MKVFTVGLDEKPPVKEHPEPESVTVVPPPTIAVERKMKKSYKGYMLCFATLFFVLFFALILSEIAYNRARDESFLRLRWAELRHRMGMGCNECNQQRIAQPLFRQKLKTQIFSRFDSAPIEGKELATPKSTTPSLPAVQPIDDAPKESRVLDPRFEFLRQVLTKIREQAEKAGIDGTMKVSVIRIDPAEQNQDNSVLDGFGEVQQVPQFGNSLEYQSSRRADRLFGPWISDDYFNNEDNSPQVYEVLANRRTELGPQMNGQMELVPVASNGVESSNGWSNSILPWAGTINQGQKTYETYQPIQQPEYIKFLNIQQWPQNNYQPQEQWPSYQPQSMPIQNSQWYNNENQWQNQNPLWQWQGNQWQQVNPWNQWQNGIQANNQQQQQQQNNIQWPAQQAVNSISDDNRWQASLQNNQWTIQKANPVENNQISQQQPAAQQPMQWWNTDNKWNNQIVQPQQETTQPSNAVPVIQQQPVVDWAQQGELPWTHVSQNTGDISQVEQRVILTSVENKEKPVVEQIQSALDDENPAASNPQEVPYIVGQQVPEIQQTVQLPEVVPVVQQKSEDLIKRVETEPETPKTEKDTETEIKLKPAEELIDEPLKTHIADLPTLELTYQKHQIIPFSESDTAEEQPQKIDFPAVKFPAQPLNEAEDVSSHIFFQVDEPQPQFGDTETFAAK